MTITISREDADLIADALETSALQWNIPDDERLANILRAALKETE